MQPSGRHRAEGATGSTSASEQNETRAGSSTSDGDADDWQTKSTAGFRYAAVRGGAGSGGKKRRQKGSRNAGPATAPLDEEDNSTEAKQQRLEKRLGIVRERRRLLAVETFQDGLQDSLARAGIQRPSGTPKGKEKASWPSGPPRRILCLGLGSVKDNRVAQIQLALLLELREAVQRHHGAASACQVEACDPIWTDEDEAVLKALDVDPISSDEGGAYLLSEPTLLYMPHCDRALYEALLRRNWTPQGLRRLTLCANDLSRYSDLDPRLANNSPAVARAIPHLVSVPLPHLSSPNNDAFNDLLLQAVRAPEQEGDGAECGLATPSAEDDLVSKLQDVQIGPQQESNEPKESRRRGRGARRAKPSAPADDSEFLLPEVFWTLPRGNA